MPGTVTTYLDFTDQLWVDYVEYWRYTSAVKRKEQELGISKLPAPHRTKQRLGALRKMALFAIEHDADPRLWLYTLFESRRWVYAPKFNCLTPKKHVERYHKERRLTFFRSRMDAERRSKSKNDVDPNVDIMTSVEGIKAQLLRTGRFSDCMDRMQIDTYGYHPKSAVCAACPIWSTCSSRLIAAVFFDIVALRRGEIDVESARQAQRDSRYRQVNANIEGFIRARAR